MTTSTPPTEAGRPVGGTPEGEPHGASPEPTVVDVPIGRRVMIVSDLLLTPTATPSSEAISVELARALEAWEGPGLLVVAGNLFDLSGSEPPRAQAEQSMAAHPRLAAAFRGFLDSPDRRLIRQPGTHEPGYDSDPVAVAALAEMGVEQLPVVDLELHTATGPSRVRVEPGEHAYAPGREVDDTSDDPVADAKPGAVGGSRAAARWHALAEQSAEDAPWLEGLDRLSDPSALSRFVTSRVLYRRYGKYAWWLLVPFALAVLLRLSRTDWVMDHLGSGLPARALRHAQQADWGDALLVAGEVAVVGLVVLVVVLAVVSRRAWARLGGGSVTAVSSEAQANDTARDAARALVAAGYDGLITAATFRSELTNLAEGFYANVGATTEVVEEQPSRMGLPPVFIRRQRLSWVELETGATLHVRLLLAQRDLRSPSALERVITFHRTERSLQPTVVASYPHGDSWPPAPDLRQAHRHTRRIRRISAAAILVAGVVDLLDAITPPLRYRLHLLLEFLPLRVTVAAGALLALAGLALIALGRGILRGQHLAWQIAVVLLGGSLALHLVAGGDVEESLLALAVLVVLIVNRREFTSASDWPSLRTAVVALVVGAVGITVAAAVSIELFAHLGRHRHHFSIPFPTAWWASAERLVGIKTVALPPHLDRFLAPALLAIGVALVVGALFLVSRPVVDRRFTSGRAAEFRARDIVRRHGASTLDYFALRTDKQWFFHRDSVVAYAIYGGICLISPDPIGPANERAQVWDAFRRFSDDHGWVPAVMGAGEDWLPVYRESGMHHIYLGDEAVVDVQRFTLSGGEKKGLRQAHNRVAKKGYTATFHDPARIDKELAKELVGLMSLSRQGEHERGFSMMLGRVFDPRDVGLLLTVVRGPDGRAVAMCQFVPAHGLHGFSLDLMRRDPGDHPNGLLDFALCSTIEHLREGGYHGLSLNFATMRSTLAGEKGDGAMQRAERWLLKRLSNFAQIESLWLFNAKYGPDWLPRYVVFDTAEHLVPVILAIVRAESLWEIPVLGKLLAVGAEKRQLAAQRETDAVLAESLDGAESLDNGDGGADGGSAEDEPSTSVRSAREQ